MKTHRAATPAPKPGLTAEDKKENAVIAASLATGPLASGTTSSAVKDLKNLLNLAGYGVGSGPSFDAKTAAALQTFQAAEGLPVTGELDQATLSQLETVQLRVRTNKDEFLGVGQKSAKVERMQKELASLGFDVPATDGVFSQADAKLINEYRASDKGLEGVHQNVPILTAGLDRLLSTETHHLDHVAYRTRVAPSKEHTQRDAAVAKAVAKTNADGTVGLGEGAHGHEVATLQSRLWSAGYPCQGESGGFGPRTKGAVEAFQRKNGLPVTGTVDSKTWSQLSKSFLYTRSATSPAQAYGENDAAVKKTQKLLQAVGEKHVPTTGLFDSRTEAAVKSFQKRNHLHVTGEVDGKTLSRLEAVVAYDRRPRAITDRSRIYLQQPTGWACAPTSLTMAEAAWGVAHPTDANVFRVAAGMGDGPGVGLPGNASLVAAQARRDGLQARYNSSIEASAVRAALKAGHTCVVNGSLGIGGHFIYLAGLDAHGNYIVCDPWRPGITRWTDADLDAFTHTGLNPPGFAEIWK